MLHPRFLFLRSAAIICMHWFRRVPKFGTYGSVCCACAQRPGLPRQSFSRTQRSQKTSYSFLCFAAIICMHWFRSSHAQLELLAQRWDGFVSFLFMNDNRCVVAVCMHEYTLACGMSQLACFSMRMNGSAIDDCDTHFL